MALNGTCAGMLQESRSYASFLIHVYFLSRLHFPVVETRTSSRISAETKAAGRKVWSLRFAHVAGYVRGEFGEPEIDQK